jgi:hypothetical protein
MKKRNAVAGTSSAKVCTERQSRFPFSEQKELRSASVAPTKNAFVPVSLFKRSIGSVMPPTTSALYVRESTNIFSGRHHKGSEI